MSLTLSKLGQGGGGGGGDLGGGGNLPHQTRHIPHLGHYPLPRSPPLRKEENQGIWSMSRRYASYWNAILFKTRLHSSRMHTTRTLTVVPVCRGWRSWSGEGMSPPPHPDACENITFSGYATRAVITSLES